MVNYLVIIFVVCFFLLHKCWCIMPQRKSQRPNSLSGNSASDDCTVNCDLGQLAPILGQLLRPKPNTSKITTMASNDNISVCISSMQGWRQTMEDTSCLFLKIPNDHVTTTTMIGVFDGHGGIRIAEYVSKHLHKFIQKQPEYNDNLKKAIVKGFIDIDAKMRKDRPDDPSGCTAIVVFLRDDIIYCANIGDSRAIGYHGGKIVPLSHDHKPNLSGEHKRIVDAGGWVESDRVNGSLALSRAFGDFQFKASTSLKPEQQIISCVPDIVTKKLDGRWKFIVLASDGIWEVMTNGKVGDFVRYCLNEGMSLEKVCESLMSSCLSPMAEGSCLGCDNMTVALVVFK